MTRTINAVWMEKYNRWQINVWANGKRKTFASTIPGRAGKAEANRKADEWLDSQLVDGTATIATVWTKWAATITSSDGAYKAKSFWKNHIHVIEKKQISKLTIGDLQAIIDTAAKKGLAKKSLSNIRATMTAFIKWARKNKYTTITTEDISIPKNAPKGKKIIMQPDDIRTLWDGPQTLYSNLFKLAVLTGLRPGELVGLQWSDLRDNQLHIRRSVNYKGKQTDGKNENAERIIWLGVYELAVLDEQRGALKQRAVISPWIFPARSGKHAYQCNVSESWKWLSKKLGITPGVTPYGWRHTFVSVNNEMPSGLKQRRVGHAVSMDTDGVYGHAVVGEGEQTAEYIKQRFDEIFKHTKKHT